MSFDVFKISSPWLETSWKKIMEIKCRRSSFGQAIVEITGWIKLKGSLDCKGFRHH